MGNHKNIMDNLTILKGVLELARSVGLNSTMIVIKSGSPRTFCRIIGKDIELWHHTPGKEDGVKLLNLNDDENIIKDVVLKDVRLTESKLSLDCKEFIKHVEEEIITRLKRHENHRIPTPITVRKYKEYHDKFVEIYCGGQTTLAN